MLWETVSSGWSRKRRFSSACAPASFTVPSQKLLDTVKYISSKSTSWSDCAAKLGDLYFEPFLTARLSLKIHPFFIKQYLCLSRVLLQQREIALISWDTIFTLSLRTDRPEQIAWNQIRRRIMRRLIMVHTVCYPPSTFRYRLVNLYSSTRWKGVKGNGDTFRKDIFVKIVLPSFWKKGLL